MLFFFSSRTLCAGAGTATYGKGVGNGREFQLCWGAEDPWLLEDYNVPVGRIAVWPARPLRAPLTARGGVYQMCWCGLGGACGAQGGYRPPSQPSCFRTY